MVLKADQSCPTPSLVNCSRPSPSVYDRERRVNHHEHRGIGSRVYSTSMALLPTPQIVSNAEKPVEETRTAEGHQEKARRKSSPLGGPGTRAARSQSAGAERRLWA